MQSFVLRENKVFFIYYIYVFGEQCSQKINFFNNKFMFLNHIPYHINQILLEKSEFYFRKYV